MEGVRKPPAVAIDRLAALARAQDQVADSMVRALGETGSAPKVLVTEYEAGVGIGWHRDKPILNTSSDCRSRGPVVAAGWLVATLTGAVGDGATGGIIGA
jgi:hypothetical protein